MRRLQPLGVDLGTTRVRVAASERDGCGQLRLCAVASRDLPEGSWRDGGNALDLAAVVVEQLIKELGLREKRCVTAVGVPHAAIRVIAFPKMSWLERKKAARLELLGASGHGTVRVHPFLERAGFYALGVADERVLKHHYELLRKAHLRLAAIDYDGYALARTLPSYDAIADIGHELTRLHVLSRDGLASFSSPIAGEHITRSIATELSIDDESAERRKRIIGTSGAGEAALERCVDGLCSLLEQARNRGCPVTRVALLGNGSRIAGFSEAVALRSNTPTDLPVSTLLQSTDFSENVLETASSDWTLAAALSRWRAA
jgi:Tfp pilus assembly PilM family ATPase